MSSIYSTIKEQAEKDDSKIALYAPDYSPCTYGELITNIEKTASKLNSFGITRNDRIAVVLPDGPEMVTLFLSVVSCATCAPLNPRYKEEEYEFYLNDLNAKAVITQFSLDNPVIKTAKKLGIRLIDLVPDPSHKAGSFKLEYTGESTPVKQEYAEATDTALVLHTSGTTSRPKIVPLTHKNLLASANNIRTTLRLTQGDKCLNIMPLFHIHGLIGALLSSITSGAGIICSPGLNIEKFIDWVNEFHPTWYSAVPTMHYAILTKAKENRDIIKNNPLRFIRSSSTALPSQLMNGIETVFNAPVIESYGMTEASHQMTSNQLPPGIRKPGSVGLPAGPEVGIMDEDNNFLAIGEKGEVVIKGPNVTLGYENNEEANRKSFTNGWFHTGDEGYFDEDEYLFLTDRIKEIINRGGEKISPREIDEVLLSHPAVAQVVTFAIPHKTLGEEVAAAIILEPGADCDEWSIQEYAQKRLADYKVPKTILFMDSIPKGPTGKMKRIGLAEKLGLTETSTKNLDKYEAPVGETEEYLAKVWSQFLGLERVGVTSNYFALGGDSIKAGQILGRISEKYGLGSIPLVIFLHSPTVREMAKRIDNKQLKLPPASLVAIHPQGKNIPLYFVHACDGEILFLTTLARELGEEQPFYGLRVQGLDGGEVLTSIESMATHYLREIRAQNPDPPYMFGGAGPGGMIAYEMAKQLNEEGIKVNGLYLVDTIYPHDSTTVFQRFSIPYVVKRIKANWGEGTTGKWINSIFQLGIRKLLSNIRRRDKVWNTNQRALREYPIQKTGTKLVLFVPERNPLHPGDPSKRYVNWVKLNPEAVVEIVQGEHLDVFKEPWVKDLASKIKKHME